jgi:hypothetical protein
MMNSVAVINKAISIISFPNAIGRFLRCGESGLFFNDDCYFVIPINSNLISGDVFQ